MNPPYRQIRAVYNDSVITVYQAYSAAIAEPAVLAQRFVDPFRLDRMTWIKPSFLWMMYRCGWATKAGQERVLAVDISREGFDWALENSCLSHYDPHLYQDRTTWQHKLRHTSVRIQWDPERSIHLGPLPYRSLQMGLSGPAVHKYVEEWVRAIRCINPLVETIASLVRSDRISEAQELLPKEQEYPPSP